MGVLNSVREGVELDAEMGPIESLVRDGGLSRRSSAALPIAGPAKVPVVNGEPGESPETEGVLATLAADGLCFRKGFLGGRPGRLESPGEDATCAVPGTARDSKRATSFFSGVLYTAPSSDMALATMRMSRRLEREPEYACPLSAVFGLLIRCTGRLAMDEVVAYGDIAGEGLPCAVTGRRAELWTGELVVLGWIWGAKVLAEPERGRRRGDSSGSADKRGDDAARSTHICDGGTVEGLPRPTEP